MVFDEAYREYLDPALAFDPCAIMREAGLDWISLRTFSKAYGLAGGRVGYGLCASPALTRALHKTRNPFAVKAFAGAAARAALQDQAHLARTVALARSERARLSAVLTAAGHEVVPSQANFLFFRTPTRPRISPRRCGVGACWSRAGKSRLPWTGPASPSPPRPKTTPSWMPCPRRKRCRSPAPR
ncbi:aminotransferase class I/II-fold pyridoxal phosphate-dependent enzyme [Paracoccus sp. 11-3]|uniref:Aminotransferase class I/II-fold pyridoxal phosphate-dependent enzyme n=1 Tax=Paracoccus amoyensis TaxID=2760093 RepID=A0A926GHU3_9RHOB|nr:aminotransferase class I/II-fold pyridoxal phosphate-dependent enzyme [Paracoccus amoyensis]